LKFRNSTASRKARSREGKAKESEDSNELALKIRTPQFAIRIFNYSHSIVAGGLLEMS
jgi:hypothetical protein